MRNKNEFIRGKPADASGKRVSSFFIKLLFWLVILAGLQAAALKFSYSTGYNLRLLGTPSFILTVFGKTFPFYPFYYIFIWTLANFRYTAIVNLLYQAWLLAAYVCFAGVFLFLFLEFATVGFKKQNVFGTARWAKKGDLEKAGLLHLKGGVIIGQTSDAVVATKNNLIVGLRKPGRIILQPGIYNINLAAPTRSGKGVSCVIPTLLLYPDSVIVLDFKGENFNITSGYRSKFSKIYRWEPTGNSGHYFNPMMEIRPGINAFKDSNLMADILTTPPSGGGNATSDHFQTAAKDFLTSVILHCRYCPDWHNKSLAGCREFLAQIDPEDPDNTKYVYDLMINGDHGDPLIHQAVIEGAGAQRKRPDDEGGSVLSTVNNALAVFADPIIKRNTSASEFYIDEFQETKFPISLYLSIQYDDIERIAPLVRMFILLFSRRFTGGETQATNRKFKVPILFILDEFDKLGRMDELERNMGIHNGFGIHYFLIYQSLSQLNKLYTNDHSLLAHCRNSLFFAPAPTDYNSADIISKICGKESFSKTNISYSGNRGSYNSSSLSSQDQERNLINPDEVMKLPLDSFVLLCQGIPPYVGKKIVYYDDPRFKPRLCYPAFTTREEAVKQAEKTIRKIKKRTSLNALPETKDIEMDGDELAAMYEKFGGEAAMFDKLEGVLVEDENDVPAGSPVDVDEAETKNNPFNPL